MLTYRNQLPALARPDSLSVRLGTTQTLQQIDRNPQSVTNRRGRGLSKLWLAAVALVVAVPAHAADDAPVVEKWPMRWDLGLGLGFDYLSEFNFIGNGGALEDRPDSAGMFALRGTGWLLDNLGAEAEIKIVPTSFRNGNGGSATIYGLRANAIYNLADKEATMRPYLTAGAGLEIFRASKSQAALKAVQTFAKDADQDVAYLLGAGVQWQFLHRIGLRIDARYVAMGGKEAADLKGNAVSHLASNFEALLSLAYTIGGKPGDADGDGILDGTDKCEEQAEDKDGFQDADGCPELDNDGDGIPDVDLKDAAASDKCPNEPEDKDGYMDYDGCPELDNDEDGVLDTDDKCPTQKEDKDGFEDNDGCPEIDNDKDGIPDTKDKCKNEKEDMDGFKDEDGCPELDNDNDGILDAKDKCPNEPETKNGFQDEDGCKDDDPDDDKDGISNSKDKCADKPETKNGFQDDDGCPDELPKELKKFHGAMQGIEFETGSAMITAKSNKVLDEAAKNLVTFPDTRLEVTGHTDNQGDAAANKKLSLERAEAVKAYLAGKGVDASRIVAVGEGDSKPVADNKNKAGQAKNRRIEFKLL
ncbi:MAG: OmpA family protein [Myxococcales bacterium]|nr:OmpA family protein [Myxococcales bacterium]